MCISESQICFQRRMCAFHKTMFAFQIGIFTSQRGTCAYLSGTCASRRGTRAYLSERHVFLSEKNVWPPQGDMCCNNCNYIWLQTNYCWKIWLCTFISNYSLPTSIHSKICMTRHNAQPQVPSPCLSLHLARVPEVSSASIYLSRV